MFREITMKNQITTYFEERIAACQAAAAALTADDRADEAVFEKIRMNVFDIFCTVYNAGAQVSGGDPVKQLHFLCKRLEQIPASWEKALETALAHGNSEKSHIEQIKLDAVAEIRRKATEWSEEK